MTLCCAGELNGLTNEFLGGLHLPVGVLGHFQNPVGLGERGRTGSWDLCSGESRKWRLSWVLTLECGIFWMDSRP